MGPAALGETIAVVDKSGKIISTSKHLINVFREAKSAYRERKAEIAAERQAQVEMLRARRALEQFSFDDGKSQASRATRRTSRSRPQRPRQIDGRTERSAKPPPSYYEHGPAPSGRALERRHTQYEVDHVNRYKPQRSSSTPGQDNIDMDLAYGDLPPNLAPADPRDEEELKGLFSRVHGLLDEAHCIHHSVTTTITSLQKNPDALAAVALTLAEISNLAAKMAPGVLTGLKGSFPAIFAILASPQFMIAAGVGVGITVVALGGYKIIKKIQAPLEEEPYERSAPIAMAMPAVPAADELEELDSHIGRIEAWRRGIADAEAQSIATTVDGEFITPEAAAMTRALQEEELRREERHHKPSKSRDGRSRAGGAKSTRGGGKSTRGGASTRGGKDVKEKKDTKKKKKSPLLLLFH